MILLDYINGYAFGMLEVSVGHTGCNIPFTWDGTSGFFDAWEQCEWLSTSRISWL